MKVYKLPQGLEAPEPDYSNYDAKKEQAAEAAHMQAVRDWLKKNGYTGPHSGKIYREGVADGYAQYMMADGPKSFLLHLPYGDAYQSRTVSGMSKASVVKLIAAEDNFAKLFHGNRDDFWASQEVGNVLHYHNSFGAFVRGVVVENDGQMELKPTALVGNWGNHDLPRRYADGRIHLGYHAGQIAEGASWQPSDGCVYESSTYSESYARYGDPRVLEEINLTIPEMSDDEVRRAKREVLIRTVIEQASHENRSRGNDDSLEVMKRMANLLNAYLEIQ